MICSIRSPLSPFSPRSLNLLHLYINSASRCYRALVHMSQHKEVLLQAHCNVNILYEACMKKQLLYISCFGKLV